MHKSSKNSRPTRKPGDGQAFLQQMGLQMPNFDGTDMMNMPDDDNDDLEAELNRLQQGSGPTRKRGAATTGKPNNLQAFHNDVNKLLRDIDAPINDDDLSDADENDLLAELNELTEEFQQEDEPQPKRTVENTTSGKSTLSILQERQDSYVKVIAAAKANGDSNKARRLERLLKTIEDMLKTVRTGGTINENDIPPPVFVTPGTSAPPPPQQIPTKTVPIQEPIVRKPQPQPQPQTQLQPERRPPMPAAAVSKDSDPAIERLKALALQANRMGDKTKAKEYLLQIRALREGATSVPIQKETYDNVPENDYQPNEPPSFKAPEPKTIMEALQQRYEELNKSGEEAARSGNTSKARRLERVSKQYEEAMIANKKGQPYDYANLPDIPGFAPIPVSIKSSPPGPSSSTAAAAIAPVAPPPSAMVIRKNQQIQTLRSKQEQFHQLAAQAKRRGDIETAKKFLIAERGLEQMIEAASNGLPIDMSQVPKLPDEQDTTINDDDLTEDLVHADRETVYRRLQEDLLRQIQVCAKNQQICEQMEDPESDRQAHEYKLLEQRCARDLEKLRKSFQLGLKPPLFHYERRQMTIIQSNNELGDNDLEITVIRGINLPVPAGTSASSLETCVIIEFPYPTDEPQIAKTRHAIGSAIADYPDGQHKFYIKRNDAKFRRLMNRKEMKFAIFYKPGFLRSDRPLGTATLKLATMDTSCTIHESVDLYEPEHRKKIEGKLEVKLRIKEALGQTKASDILPQRWLMIDRFEDMPHSSKSSSSNRAVEVTHQPHRRKEETPLPTPLLTPLPVSRQAKSIQVLNYEAKLLREQIKAIEQRITLEQRKQLEAKLHSIEDDSDRLANSLREGGRVAVHEHIRRLDGLIEFYEQEGRQYLQQNERKKADIAFEKKRLVQKEIDTLGGTPPPISSTRL